MLRIIAIALIFFHQIGIANAQKVNEPKGPKKWSKSYPAFRIVGNLYWVGTEDLACYLITSPQGHILINTGLASSEKQIKKNLKKLGFALADIKILLTTQAHYDHLGAMAAIKEQTGAKFYANQKDAEVIQTGGKTDFELSHYSTSFRPIEPDMLLTDGQKISLGSNTLTMLHHPGHTKGSCSYSLTVSDQDKDYQVLIANMPTIVTDQPLRNVSNYPSIITDLEHTFRSLSIQKFDIWLASHASQFGLHNKRKPTDAYNPAVFIDQQGFDKALEELQADFDKKLNYK
jgi:metallo-beta-lactamase class B